MGGKTKKRRTASYKDWTTEEGLLKIRGWARDGLINSEIAEEIGIAEGTLYSWKNKYKEIDEALKDGQDIVDRKVEESLFKKAMGYEYEETKQIIEKDEMGKDRKRVEKVTKYYPPDSTAIIFWLKNRKPGEWRDRRDSTVDVKSENVVIIDDIK